MNQTIRNVVGDEASGMRSRRLTLLEFGSILSQAGVSEDEEHAALFNAICSDDDGTVSIEELHCAIAAVSPSLLLEDLRERLSRRYKGDWTKAYFDLNADHGDNMTRSNFVQKCVDVFALSRAEAEKVFREIDVDHSGDITVPELLSALAVVEPTLSIEDLRFKLRQRLQAIREALNKAFADDVLDGEHSLDAIPKPRFQAVLEPVGLSPAETDRLFHILDADGDGELTPGEFLAGLRRLVPSHVLEDLRSSCWQQHGHVRNAFRSVKSGRAKPMLIKALANQLEALGLLDSPRAATIQPLFDLIDVNNDGLASINRLVAALCAAGAGSHAKLPPEELSQKAREDIASDFAPFVRQVNDFKTQVRFGLEWDAHAPWPKDQGKQQASPEVANEKARSSSAPGGAGARRRSSLGGPHSPGLHAAVIPAAAVAKDSAQAQPVVAMDSDADTATAESPTAAAAGRQPIAPRLKTATQEQLPDFVRAVPQLVADCRSRSELQVHDIQDSYGAVWRSLQDTPKHLRPGAKLQKSLQGYFESVSMQLSESVPYTQKLQSRLATYQSSRVAQGALKPSKSKGS